MVTFMQISRKGESLVEVVVALGIFAFIFMGVVNIIAYSVTLNLSARQRTEVVAMVQKNLNEYLALYTNTGACTVNNRLVNPVLNELPSAGCAANPMSNSTQVCYWLEIANLDTANPNESVPGYDPATHNFVKVISHGKWYTRILGTQVFEISRILRND